MPGLVDRHTRAPLPLQATRVSTCLNGLSLGLTSSITYFNDEDHVVEGVFCLALDENTSVTGFEARMSQGRNISVHVKDRSEVEHYDEILTGSPSTSRHNGSQHTYIPPGKFALTEYDSTRVFCANLGTIRPHGTVTILMCISSLLQTGKSGEVIVKLPNIFTPRYVKELVPSEGKDSNSSRQKQAKPCLAVAQHQFLLKSLILLAEEVSETSKEYDFEFQLEVKAPALLAGVSSCTHSIRVDADPYADNASDVFVTLAEPHLMDRDLEVIVHPPKPHVPVVILEHGDMSPAEYENFVKVEQEYFRTGECTESDQRRDLLNRMHKDIMHNAVSMLNYCPDYESLTRQMLHYRYDIQGEYIFMIDRSGSMSGEYIANARETLMMFLKSLPVCCHFNIVGFGSSFKPLFECSRAYTQSNIREASGYIKKMRADMGGTSLLAPLLWIYQQPVTRGWPRQLFVLTDGGVNNTGDILDLVRSHNRQTRVHTFGVGENVSKRLVKGMARAGRGRAEFIAIGDRMQTKVLNTLKFALQPCISDIRLEWCLPFGVEVLQTPSVHPPMFQGEPLVVYGLLCDTVRMHSTLASVLLKTARRNPFTEKALSRGSSNEKAEEDASSPTRPKSPVKINSQDTDDTIQDTHDFLPPKSQSNGLTHSTPPMVDDIELPPPSSVENSPRRRKLSNVGQTAQKRYLELAAKRNRAVSVPDNRFGGVSDPVAVHTILTRLEATTERRQSESQLHPLSARSRKFTPVLRSEGGSTTSFDFEPSSPAWDNFMESGDSEELFDREVQMSLNDAGVLDDGKLVDMSTRTSQCSVIVSGLFCGRPISCEVPFDISTLVRGEWVGPCGEEDVWEETIHQIAAKRLLQDFDSYSRRLSYENSDKRSFSEATSEELLKIRTRMLEVSQAANVICRHTAFVSVDQETLEPLPSPIQVIQPTPRISKPVGRRSIRFGYSKGLGRRISSSFTDSEEDGFSSGLGRSDSMSSSQSQSQPYSASHSLDLPHANSPTWTSHDTPEWSVAGSFTNLNISKPKPWQLATRLIKLSNRLSTMPSKKPLFRAIDMMEGGGRTLSMETVELHALVNVQLSNGSWELDQELAEALDIPLERLKRASPLCIAVCDEESVFEGDTDTNPKLSSPSNIDTDETYTSQEKDKDEDEVKAVGSPLDGIKVPTTLPQSDSGYQTVRSCFSSPDECVLGALTMTYSTHVESSQTESIAAKSEACSSPGSKRLGSDDSVGEVLENRMWATVLSLTWLEHNCASFFNEWELLAAKADRWLNDQRLPRGYDLPGLKAASYQVIVLSRKYSS
ncbi:von Willebrand factor A domain-containing protein 5B1-like [Asterias rubens]|uniref:von Willebrand factor A domain-containing protein 5B1-like n=1 Tax=Asterias rubens TaxID=7604 RepID=UPI0014558698|nr:von Willebrand factor A domain-containing protein 5B1-like [Asterias rubens]XP_033642069.1 von Willebrand factor A domain-containing protein 5B1-like [Asterias rubens]XP_033642070.1 von Willebrand factor A domain-containing protein 5B1-like [Asterias rubens]